MVHFKNNARKHYENEISLIFNRLQKRGGSQFGWFFFLSELSNNKDFWVFFSEKFQNRHKIISTSSYSMIYPLHRNFKGWQPLQKFQLLSPYDSDLFKYHLVLISNLGVITYLFTEHYRLYTDPRRSRNVQNWVQENTQQITCFFWVKVYEWICLVQRKFGEI